MKTTSIKKWIYILPVNLGILSSRSLRLSLSKLSRNWIWDTAINLKQNKISKKLAVVVHVLQTTQNWSFHVVVLQRTAKKCTKSYNACAQLLFCSLNLLFSDIAVAIVVFLLNSLMTYFGFVINQDKCRNNVNHNVPVKSKLQHPPAGNPWGIWIFEKFLFKSPPTQTEKLFKCPPPPGKLPVRLMF